MSHADSAQRSVVSLAGIGANTAAKLEKLGIFTLQDLLFHLPLRYEDRTHISPIGSLKPGVSALIKGTVALTDVVSRGRKSLIVKIGDGTGMISLRFFHFSAGQLKQLTPGTVISCFGESRYGYAGFEMVHPEYTVISSADMVITESRLTPVYPLTEGVRQSTLRKAIKHALSLCQENPSWLTDWLPSSLLKSFNYPSLMEAIHTLHAPDESVTVQALYSGSVPALKRLAFEELLAHHLSLRLSRHQARAWQAPVFSLDPSTRRHFFKSLPFTLTGAQQRVITEIETDCKQPHPMLRLVQGDVGSGKTIVSAYAALLALTSGLQVAVMAPTELLAEQHFRNFTGWFKGFQTEIVYLTGQMRGSARKSALQMINEGSAGIIIGTHALFQEQVNFHKLGLVIIDEQHRFGVDQRMALRDKCGLENQRPHQLVMTATPIPRTLAMLNYSDLDISIIDELPPGRQPVITSVIPAERRPDVIARISSWVAQKRQAYWVCTLIEESELLQCEAAEKTYLQLSEALPGIKVSLVHGRMKSTDKDAVMKAFKNGEYDLLVATTVIEVGVDVPNASLMIIENPERLGLSQLHQLRGRVGRGQDASYCVLMYQSPLSDTAKHRLSVLRDSNDGFVIAEKDLELRGPGEVMGTRQTGQMQFKVVDLARDTDLLDNVQQIADSLITETPEAVSPLINRWLGKSTHYAEV
ncbi:ATP-dependent DNA helicase RecG [Methylicorpusculum oleiharenae]|uniref:ATP-dependent DNA helicase RecG n=1 Tax=Methylicorpusculum oleiharenae TaxID=1338687 RepID=UPI001357B030|nr:ATP-dependent DNA helicase RecG [Methylicorpusculum oleiharenae]MCD2449171.1 ATP-dependent DNA helicase RecG [Methylicorpusculum oleiharenae]